MRRPVIDIDRDLPSRPQPLTANALSKVFGGCPDRCIPRQPNICCDGYSCNKQWDNSYRCSGSAWI